MINRLRAAVISVQQGDGVADAAMDDLLGPELAEILLSTRLGAQDATRASVLGELRQVAPTARITLHGQPDPWATGPSPAVTAEAAAQVDAILVPAWVHSPATTAAVAAARDLAPGEVSVGAYVTALPPADLDTIDGHVAGLIAAGAGELHLYHLGLANRRRLDVLRRLASVCR